jgi:hypothetical protein
VLCLVTAMWGCWSLSVSMGNAIKTLKLSFNGARLRLPAVGLTRLLCVASRRMSLPLPPKPPSSCTSDYSRTCDQDCIHAACQEHRHIIGALFLHPSPYGVAHAPVGRLPLGCQAVTTDASVLLSQE